MAGSASSIATPPVSVPALSHPVGPIPPLQLIYKILNEAGISIGDFSPISGAVGRHQGFDREGNAWTIDLSEYSSDWLIRVAVLKLETGSVDALVEKFESALDAFEGYDFEGIRIQLGVWNDMKDAPIRSLQFVGDILSSVSSFRRDSVTPDLSGRDAAAEWKRLLAGERELQGHRLGEKYYSRHRLAVDAVDEIVWRKRRTIRHLKDFPYSTGTNQLMKDADELREAERIIDDARKFLTAYDSMPLFKFGREIAELQAQAEQGLELQKENWHVELHDFERGIRAVIREYELNEYGERIGRLIRSVENTTEGAARNKKLNDYFRKYVRALKRVDAWNWHQSFLMTLYWKVIEETLAMAKEEAAIWRRASGNADLLKQARQNGSSERVILELERESLLPEEATAKSGYPEMRDPDHKEKARQGRLAYSAYVNQLALSRLVISLFGDAAREGYFSEDGKSVSFKAGTLYLAQPRNAVPMLNSEWQLKVSPSNDTLDIRVSADFYPTALPDAVSSADKEKKILKLVSELLLAQINQSLPALGRLSSIHVNYGNFTQTLRRSAGSKGVFQIDGYSPRPLAVFPSGFGPFPNVVYFKAHVKSVETEKERAIEKSGSFWEKRYLTRFGTQFVAAQDRPIERALGNLKNIPGLQEEAGRNVHSPARSHKRRVSAPKRAKNVPSTMAARRKARSKQAAKKMFFKIAPKGPR